MPSVMLNMDKNPYIASLATNSGPTKEMAIRQAALICLLIGVAIPVGLGIFGLYEFSTAQAAAAEMGGPIRCGMPAAGAWFSITIGGPFGGIFGAAVGSVVGSIQNS